MPRPSSVALVALGALLLSLALAWAPPFFDPDEGYYPATAAEGLDRGEPFDLHFNGAPRWDKPILQYALIEASFAAFGRSELAARLVPAIEGAVLVLVLGALVGRVAGARAGLLAAVVLATSLGHQVFSLAAHPEMALVLGTAAAELCVAAWLVLPEAERPRGLPALAGLAMGLGVLAKGPVAVALPALMLLAGLLLARGQEPGAWRRVARPAGVALGIAILVAAPWFAAMARLHGSEYLRVFFLEHNVRRYATDLFHHPGSALYFVPVALVGVFPWTGFLPWALTGIHRDDSSPRGRLRLLMAAAFGTSFVFYSLSASKLPGYGLVFLPPLAVLVALRLDEWIEAGPAEGKPPRPFAVAGAILVLVSLACMVVPPIVRGTLAPGETLGRDYPLDADGLERFWFGLWPVAGILLGIGASLFFAGPNAARVRRVACAGALVLPFTLLAEAKPDARLRPWKTFSERVVREAGPGEPVAIYRRRLPSVNFYTGRPVEWLETPGELNAFLRRPGGGFLFVSEGNLAREVRAGDVEVLDRGAGWALARKRGP